MSIQWQKYGIAKSKRDFELLTISNIDQPNLSSDFLRLREEVIAARDRVFQVYGFDEVEIDKRKYQFDIYYGLEIYELLGNTLEMDNRSLSNDDVWRYLSIKVIPDVLHARWGFNPDRYYNNSRRLYLKTLWWYIHLSWQGSVEKTFEVIKNATTDTLMNLVERPGLGYNLELYREIMKQFSEYTKNGHTTKEQLLFRRMLILNTALLKSVQPELVKDGIEGYVISLFRQVE